jgi:hypothetical protein
MRTMPDFEPLPSSEGCGLRFEGTGRMWKGTRTVGEIRDEGDPVRVRVSK